MNKETYMDHIKIINDNTKRILEDRVSVYGSDTDMLQNFVRGADICNLSPEKTCYTYMTKHLSALLKMIEEQPECYDMEQVLEKCTDIINYTKIMYCLCSEHNSKHLQNSGITMPHKPQFTLFNETVKDNSLTLREPYQYKHI